MQTNSTGCETGPLNGCSATVSFSSNVLAGDTIVVAVTVDGGSLSSISDTQNLFSSAQETVSDSYPDYAYVYYATSTGGPETVTVSIPSEAVSVQVSIFDIQGADPSSATFETMNNGLACSTGSCTASFSTSQSASFLPGAFLLGVIATSGGAGGVIAGSGFTVESTDNGGIVEYATSGVSSPTNFPVSAGSAPQNLHWAEIGLVLNPSSVTTSTSVNCSPSSIDLNSVTECTATVAGSSPTGTVTFSSSSGTGTFDPSNAECTLSSGGQCSVYYWDSTQGTPTITATYGGDSVNLESSGTFILTVSQPQNSTTTITSTSTVTSTVTSTQTSTVTSTTSVPTTVTTTFPTTLTTTETTTLSPSTMTQTVVSTTTQSPSTSTVTAKIPAAILVYCYNFGGTPVSNIAVTITNSSGYSGVQNTNSSGEVMFTDLALGDTYNVAATVNGVSLSAPVTTSQNGGTSVVVLEPSSSGSSSTQSSVIEYLAIGAVVVAILFSALFMMMRRRKQ